MIIESDAVDRHGLVLTAMQCNAGSLPHRAALEIMRLSRRPRCLRRQFAAACGAVDQGQHGDRGGGLPLGFLDAVELAVDLGARRLVARGQFLPLAGAQGQQDVVAGDALQRARGQVGRLGARPFPSPGGRRRAFA